MKSSAALNLASIGGFFILLSGIVALVLRGAILATSPLGWILQASAAFLMIWARVTFGARSFHATANPTAGGLVTTGPYHYIRHPIYSAVLMFVWTAVFSHLSLTNILCGLLATGGTGLRILSEERLLIARYPEYADYAARTKRLLPYLL